MRYCLDRFEGERAVIEREDGEETELFHVDRILVSPDSREGDVLVLREGRYETDAEQTRLRRKALFRKLNRLRENPEKRKD